MVNFSVPSDVRSLLFGSEIASLYVQPHIGGDLALLTGHRQADRRIGRRRRAFLQRTLPGLGELRSPAAVALVGRNRAQVGRRSSTKSTTSPERYAAAKSAVFGWTMGITHHLHGVDNVQAIANLALLRGMVGRPHSGLLPIRGHSNVQGIGSRGRDPAIERGRLPAAGKPLWRASCPRRRGYDTMGCIEAAHDDRAKLGVLPGRQSLRLEPRCRLTRPPRWRSWTWSSI